MWDLRFLDLAQHISSWSKDPGTKCGAVITKGKELYSVGFNGIPNDLDDNKYLHDRDLKLQIVLHAESNAIDQCNRSMEGCTVYTYPFPPCAACAARIIRKRISRVVSRNATPDRWLKSVLLGKQILEEAGIEYNVISLEKDPQR
jgi:dCMP deaminase